MSKQINNSFEDSIKKSIDSPITYPDDLKIDKTINTLIQYMPNTGNKYIDDKLPLHTRLRKDLALINKSYWLISLIIYIIGFSLTLTSKQPYITISFYSPIPFILMFFEGIKGRDLQLLELELACKYSPHFIKLRKFAVISFYNLIIISILSVLIYSIIPNIMLFDLLITWITPIVLLSNITLLIIKRTLTSYALYSILLIWLAVIISILNSDFMINALYNINLSIYIGFIIIGTIILILQLKHYFKHNLERNILYET